ncbi:MAG TPA: hypothetical protein VFH51_08015, partial [Myxococcota bacterium]|nr:hypothetical protein [Myxococcota bacterium]
MHLLPARGRAAAVCVLWTALAAEVRADEFALKSTRTGRYDYVFVGATLADNAGLPNGVNCLMPTATARVDPNSLSPRPELVSATLYLSGSLIDDGIDYPPSTAL